VGSGRAAARADDERLEGQADQDWTFTNSISIGSGFR